MKKYRVSMYYEEVGIVEIEANSEEEAKQKVYEILEQDGIENLEIDCVHREYDATNAKEIR